MVSPGIPYGWPIGFLCIPCRFLIDSLWMHYGFSMDSLCIPFLFTMDSLWIPSRFLMESLRFPMDCLCLHGEYQVIPSWIPLDCLRICSWIPQSFSLGWSWLPNGFTKDCPMEALWHDPGFLVCISTYSLCWFPMVSLWTSSEFHMHQSSIP